MLSVEGLAHRYPDGTEALRGIDLHVTPGIFGLLGPNGAGKSTLMQLLATLLRPTRGAIRFGELDVLAQPQLLRRALGYLPQDFGVYPNATAADLLDQLALLKGMVGKADRRAEADRLLRTVNLHGARDRAVSSYSGGMRQRFGVAQALIGDPKLIIVDEPTAGLDPEERNRLYDLLAGLAERAVVIVSTHIIEDVASLCDRLAVLAGGELRFTGTPNELLAPLRDRVWESEAEPAGGQLLSSRLLGGRRSYRVLADAPPAPHARPAEPQLEDAYLAVLRAPP